MDDRSVDKQHTAVVEVVVLVLADAFYRVPVLPVSVPASDDDRRFLQSDENDDENREDARQCQSYVVALLLFRKVHTMD